jgi:hypothetical protein
MLGYVMLGPFNPLLLRRRAQNLNTLNMRILVNFEKDDPKLLLYL